MAFFLDTWPGHPKRGSYTLTVEEAGEQAAAEHAIKAPFDGIIVERKRNDAAALYEILIKKAVGESDAAFTKRALDAARKPSGDPEVPASPARRDGEAAGTSDEIPGRPWHRRLAATGKPGIGRSRAHDDPPARTGGRGRRGPRRSGG